MNIRLLLPLAALFLLSINAYARDTKSMYSIANAMNLEAAQEKLNEGISFYFGNQKHGKIKQRFGNFQSNKKTNAVGKTDEKACNRAFLSAMIALQKRAIREGGNAVINIRSYYKKNKVISESEFECGAGAVLAGVTLTGDVVTLAR